MVGQEEAKTAAIAGAVAGAVYLGGKQVERKQDEKLGFGGTAKMKAQHEAEHAAKTASRTVQSRIVQAGMARGKSRDVVAGAHVVRSAVSNKLSNRALNKKLKQGQIAAGTYAAPPSKKQRAKDNAKKAKQSASKVFRRN